MAQPPEDDDQTIHSIFPQPPPFYKHFTPANLAALKDVKDKLTTSQSPREDGNPTPKSPQLTQSSLLDLPASVRESLSYLIPPAPPSPDTEYRVFGKATKVSGAEEFSQIMKYVSARLWDRESNWGNLPLWEYEQLYPTQASSSSSSLGGGDEGTWSSLDRQTYLFRFLRSILVKHVELLGALAQDPNAPVRDAQTGELVKLREEPEDFMQPWGPKRDVYDKVKDRILREILTLVMNMHALINEYRPHQARETLIGVLEAQVERKKREIEGVKRMAGKVRETLDGMRDGVGGEADAGEEADRQVSEHDEEKESMRQIWTALDEIVGH